MLFAELSSAISGGNMLGLTEIRRRMNTLLQSLLEQEHYDFSQKRSVAFPDGSSISPGELAVAQARIVNAWTNDKESLSKTADKCLPELYALGIFKPEEVTPEDTLAIAKAYLQTQVTMHKIIEAREQGDYAFEENFVAKDSNVVSPGLLAQLRELNLPKQTDDKGTMLYSEAIEKYVNQHIEDQVWKPRMVSEDSGAGNRIIPIHKTLIDLGLLEYCVDVMRHKHRRLFPDLNRTGRGIYGAQPGKQFATIVAEVVPEPKGKTFYSLRHNFADF